MKLRCVCLQGSVYSRATCVLHYCLHGLRANNSLKLIQGRKRAIKSGEQCVNIKKKACREHHPKGDTLNRASVSLRVAKRSSSPGTAACLAPVPSFTSSCNLSCSWETLTMAHQILKCMDVLMRIKERQEHHHSILSTEDNDGAQESI